MKNAKRIHDIGMPIYDGMWCYRPGWENALSTMGSTNSGDNSTVYRFDLCSHTGTYVETSQHKLANDILLNEFGLTDFVRPCKVFTVGGQSSSKGISLGEFESSVSQIGETIEPGDSVIIATGWGLQHREPDYLEKSPFFDNDLVDWLCEKKLHLLGVDTPIIDNAQAPYGAVRRLFESNPRMLLIAPLVIDLSQVKSGRYLLVAAPLNIESVSASLCRPLLIESESSS